MRSDPLDVAAALRIGRGTLRKMRQNLGWAVGYNAVALPIAAGAFEPAFGFVLRPEIAALSMSGSSVIVAVNALMLKRLHLPVTPKAGRGHEPTPLHPRSTWLAAEGHPPVSVKPRLRPGRALDANGDAQNGWPGPAGTLE